MTKESIEEHILHLHDAKRNVLENVWTGEGQDVVAAPGGSGAFNTMLEELLKTAGPEPSISGIAEASAATEPAAEEPVGDQRSAEPAKADWRRPADEAREPSGHPETVVDPQILAQAVAAVAPVLPKDHRRSLATVFRALADVLEDPG